MRFGRISNVLTDLDCHDITDKVKKIHPVWLNRSTCKPKVPFYTLGATTYLEGCDDIKKYHKHKSLLNPILRKNFTYLYDIVCDRLSIELDAPVVTDDMLGHPGFHIFGMKPGETGNPAMLKALEQPLASIHLDIQYKEHGPYWKTFEEVDFENPLSFTLAIKLPKTGGGLYIWDWMKFDDHLIRDFNFQEEKEKSDWVSNQFIEHSKENIKNNPNLWENDSASFYQPDGNPKVEMYHEGSMIWFTGHVLHQIIPGYKLNPDDMRITLQGHGVKCDGTWRIYF